MADDRGDAAAATAPEFTMDERTHKGFTSWFRSLPHVRPNMQSMQQEAWLGAVRPAAAACRGAHELQQHVHAV